MSEPMCGWCYRATLSADERQRLEPGTGCIYLCPEHQVANDAFMERFAHRMIAQPPASKDAFARCDFGSGA